MSPICGLITPLHLPRYMVKTTNSCEARDSYVVARPYFHASHMAKGPSGAFSLSVVKKTSRESGHGYLDSV